MTTKSQLVTYRCRKYKRRKIKRKELTNCPSRLVQIEKILIRTPRKPCSGKRPIAQAFVMLHSTTRANYIHESIKIKPKDATGNENKKKRSRIKRRMQRRKFLFLHIPGTFNKPKISYVVPHRLFPKSTVLIEGAHPNDIPAIKYAAVRQGERRERNSFKPWPFRRTSRSQYATPGPRPYEIRNIRKYGGNNEYRKVQLELTNPIWRTKELIISKRDTEELIPTE